MCAKTHGISRHCCRSSRGTGGQEDLRDAIRICCDRHASAAVCPDGRCVSAVEVTGDTHDGRLGEFTGSRGKGGRHADLPAPDPLVTWRRSGRVLRPSATTAVPPDVVDRTSRTAFALLAGASDCPDPELLQPCWRVSMLKHRTRKTVLTTWVCRGMRLPFSLTQVVASVRPPP